MVNKDGCKSNNYLPSDKMYFPASRESNIPGRRTGPRGKSERRTVTRLPDRTIAKSLQTNERGNAAHFPSARPPEERTAPEKRTRRTGEKQAPHRRDGSPAARSPRPSTGKTQEMDFRRINMQPPRINMRNPRISMHSGSPSPAPPAGPGTQASQENRAGSDILPTHANDFPTKSKMPLRSPEPLPRPAQPAKPPAVSGRPGKKE